MPEHGILLLARAAGRDFLLSASDLIEVLPASHVTPLPGPLPAIAGVVLYQGEFLPVLDWSGLPEGGSNMVWATALAVLKRHLGLPLEILSGALEPDRDAMRIEPPGGDPWAPFLSGMCVLEDSLLPILDADKLVDWLHHRRTAH